MKVFRSRLFAACAASVVTAAIVGGAAWAAKTPPQNPVDANGVVHACYNPANGSIELNVATACPAKGLSTPITWAGQQSPQTPSIKYAVKFGFSTAGCAANQIQLVVIKEIGTPLPWNGSCFDTPLVDGVHEGAVTQVSAPADLFDNVTQGDGAFSDLKGSAVKYSSFMSDGVLWDTRCEMTIAALAAGEGTLSGPQPMSLDCETSNLGSPSIADQATIMAAMTKFQSPYFIFYDTTK
jgi:hypothetical protein